MKAASVFLLVVEMLLSGPATEAAAEGADYGAEIVPGKYASVALGREVAYSVSVPAGEAPAGGWPLVLLLHGDGRNHRTVAEDATSARLARRQPFAIVFANGDRGWYLDSAAIPASRYAMMLRELLAHARKTLPVSAAPELTAVCGWSMGGYGAMRFAQNNPGEVSAVATTIALLDFPNPELPREENYPVADVFGTDRKLWPAMNCRIGIGALGGKRICIVSATSAFDATMNRRFHLALTEAGIAHTFREVPGTHDFPTVRATLPLLFEFLAEHFRSSLLR